ncbi:AAA family ATPase [Thauera sp.]|jgi:WD40 repeat protein|uniref:nSTAND1 domain-containing NTPase n=1 Tax=Thauera sp. TaxID=1905334 RepID=UPI002624A6F0|nr:AAA family ATPase [Thauera sp.]
MLPDGSPYPGLRPFEASETHLFFGREEQVDALLARLHRSRLVAVVGESGAGKSSLVRAGLLPALEAGFLADAGSDWRILLMRPGAAPLEALTEALLGPGVLSPEGGVPPHAFAAAELRRGPLGLLQLLRDTRLPAHGNLLLVVDQFEELFRFRSAALRDEADAFVDLLLHSVAQRELPLYLVLTMRSDYIGACARFPGLPEALNDNQFLTPRLTRSQLAMAIDGPARVFGGVVDPALIATLENEVGDDPDQLPLLQHLLMRLWERASREGLPPRLTLELLEKPGGLHGALEQHLEELFAGLTSAQQAICAALFKAVTGGEHGARDLRRPARLADVADAIGTDTARLAEVIEVFRAPGRNFLMPPPGIALAPDTRLDISHESLIRQWPRLRAWVGEEAEDAHTFLELRARARRWTQSSRDSAELATRNDLQRALAWRARGTTNGAWAARYAPVDTEYTVTLEFIEASAAEDRLQRNERKAALEREAAMAGKLLRLSGVLGVLGALAGLFGVFAVLAKEQADASRVQAHALKLVADARAAYFTGAPGALQSSLKAVLAGRDNPEAIITLRRTTGSPVRVHTTELRASGNTQPGSAGDALLPRFTLGKASFDMQGRAVAIPGSGGAELRRLDASEAGKAGALLIVPGDSESAVRAARFLPPRGERIFTLHADDVVRIWRTVDREALHALDHGGGRISAAEADAAGTRLLTAGRNAQGDGEARLWDLGNGQRVDLRPLRYADDAILHAVFSPDGKQILTLAEGGYATVWDALSGIAVKELAFERIVGESGTSSERRASSCSAAVKAGISFSPDGHALAVLDRAGRGTLFDTAAYALGTRTGWQLPAHERFCSLAWSHDGSRLAVATSEGRVRIWDALRGRRLPNLPRNAEWAQTVVFHPSDADILLTSGGERGVAFWHLGGDGTQRAPIQIDLLRDPSLIHEAVFSPDGTRLLTLAEDDALRLWQLPDHGERSTAFESLAPQQVADPQVGALRARADGSTAAALRLQLGDLQAGCHPLARAPDGGRVALACTRSEAQGRAVSHELKLVTEGESVVVWSPAQPIAVAAFDRSGQRIALALENGMLHMLELSGGRSRELGSSRLEPTRRRGEHGGRIADLQFNGDGTLLATAASDGTIRILDRANLRQLAVASLPGAPAALAFADNDRRVLALVGDRLVAWRCPVCGSVDDLIERAQALLAESGSAPPATTSAPR